MRRWVSVGRNAALAVRSPWGILAGTWFLWLFIGAYVIVPASVMVLIRNDLAVSSAAGAWIITMPQLAATIVGIPAAMYLDRIDDRTAVGIAVGLLLLAGIWGTLAARTGQFGWLLASRFVGGVTLIGVWVAGTSMISSAFPEEKKSTAVAIYTTGYPAGYALGQFSGPFVVGAVGWTSVFLLFGLLATVAFGLFVYASQDVTTDRTAGQAPDREDFKHVLTDSAVWFVCTLSLLIYALYMVFNSWIPTYLTQEFGLDLVESGLFVALLPAAGIVSRVTGGVLSDRVFDQRKRPVVAISFLATIGLTVVMAAIEEVVAMVVLIVAVGFAIQLQIGILYTYVQDFVEENVAGTAVGMVSVVGWLGTVVAPVVAGMLLDLTGDFQYVFGYALAIGVAGVIVTAVAPE